MRRLRAQGVIRGTVAVIDPAAVGYPVLIMVRVKLERPHAALTQSFEQRMRALPQVIQCLTVAGDIDYVLLLRARDIAGYQAFARDIFASDDAIRSYTTDAVLEVAKWTTEVPLDAVSVV